MSRKTLTIISLLFLSVTAILANQTQYNSTQNFDARLDSIKEILHSHEWQPVNEDNYRRMVELINFVEHTPIDTVVVNLRLDIENMPAFFYREIKDISEAEEVRGYINAETINQRIIEIENEIIDNTPLESILVPEEEFMGMYSQIPLITQNNIEQMLIDSIITIPDSLILKKLESENGNARNGSRRYRTETEHRLEQEAENDSLITVFLNEARKQYNDSLIDAFRDSVSYAYQSNVRQNIIENAKNEYIDQTSALNYRILKAYNDSLTTEINNAYRELLISMVNHVHRMPNTVTMYNLFGESSELPLQNEGVWFKWVQLKNMHNDSIGIRIENLGRNTMRVLVDEAVNLSRLTQRSSININQLQIESRTNHGLSKVTVPKPRVFPWKFVGRVYSGFTQTYMNEFWSKGGVKSASTMTTFNYDANYSKGKMKWENGVDMKLGFIYYIDENPNALRDWHKNTDNIELNSRFGYSAINNWYYSAEANFKTQFALGYSNNVAENPNSGFMSPAHLTFSAGLDYKPNNSFSLFVSPLSLRTTYVLNPDIPVGRFGLSEGETRRSRLGMTGRVNYSKEIFSNVSIRTRNNLFINFGRKDGELQTFKFPDIDSETTIDLKLTRYISTQINLHFIYDKELTSTWTDENEVEQSGTRLQFKEYLTFGLSYRF